MFCMVDSIKIVLSNTLFAKSSYKIFFLNTVSPTDEGVHRFLFIFIIICELI